jgi:hypothetical protein
VWWKVSPDGFYIGEMLPEKMMQDEFIWNLKKKSPDSK